MRRLFAFSAFVAACTPSPQTAPPPAESAAPIVSAAPLMAPPDDGPNPRRVRCGVDDRPQSVVGEREHDDDEVRASHRQAVVIADRAFVPPGSQSNPTFGPRANVAEKPLEPANPGVAPATLAAFVAGAPTFAACSADGGKIQEGPVSLRVTLGSSGAVLGAELDRDPIGIDRCLLDVVCSFHPPAGPATTVSLPLDVSKSGPPRLRAKIEAPATWSDSAKARATLIVRRAATACFDEGTLPPGPPVTFTIDPAATASAGFSMPTSKKTGADQCVRGRVMAESANFVGAAPTGQATVTVAQEPGVAWPKKLRVVDVLIAYRLPKGKSREADQAQAIAETARKRILAGEDPGAVAIDLSDDPMAKETRGDLGPIRTGTIDTEFEREVFRLNLHETSEPLPLVFGVHVITRIE